MLKVPYCKEKLLMLAATAFIGMAGALPAIAAGPGDADSLLGVRTGVSISDALPRCSELPPGDHSTTCYREPGPSLNISPTHYYIERSPDIGFEYSLVAGVDEDDLIAYIALSTPAQNASFLRHLLTVRYGSEPDSWHQYIYSKDGKGGSEILKNEVWAGQKMVVVFSPRDLFERDKASVIMMKKKQFEESVKTQERNVTDLAERL